MTVARLLLVAVVLLLALARAQAPSPPPTVLTIQVPDAGNLRVRTPFTITVVAGYNNSEPDLSYNGPISIATDQADAIIGPDSFAYMRGGMVNFTILSEDGGDITIEAIDVLSGFSGFASVNVIVPFPDCNINAGDTAWMAVATLLVLGMVPGLGFFEAGLLRVKNSVSVMAQVTVGVIVLSLLWFVIGYSLVFDSSHGRIIGGVRYVALANIEAGSCNYHAPNLPAYSHVAFEMMFAVITPLLMTGAFAERFPFASAIVFMTAWEIIVYYPLAHWVWGDGWLGTVVQTHLYPRGRGFKWSLGAQDFAGGIVIHTSAGVSSLICAIMIGKRRNFRKYHGEYPVSNLLLSSIGAALLWVGWFGFNGGSALASNTVAALAIFNTQLAGCSSGLVWMVLTWVHLKKPSLAGITGGVIAGFAGITPASGYVQPQAAVVMGFIFGAASFYSARLVKHKLKIDDALDVSSIHGVTGILGSIFIGLAGAKSANPAGADGAFWGGGGRLLGNQVAATAISAGWAGVWTYILLTAIRYTPYLGLRPDDTDEHRGLDAADHKEHAYNNLINPDEIHNEDDRKMSTLGSAL